MKSKTVSKGFLLGTVLTGLAAWQLPALAEQGPSLNFSGVTGLIDMPSGESQPDGMLTVSSTHFGPISRNTLSFQITDRLSGSFRFLGVRDWNRNATCLPTCTGTDRFPTYYDRSFDLRFRVLDETDYLPSVSIGLQDFVGTGVLAGEYVVATKEVVSGLKVTAGLGWGRLGSYGDIGAPFGARKKVNIGSGGNFNFSQWFRGPAAPFGGVEWKIDDNWSMKAEYSSDAYAREAADRGTFARKSPLNFGVEYRYGDSVQLGGYYLYGSEVGLAAHFIIDPKKRRGGSVVIPAAGAIEPRPSRASDPSAWSTDWVAQGDAGPILRQNLANRLDGDGVEVAAIRYDGATAEVRIVNTKLDAEAQAIGRTARALAGVMPASVERFEIVSVVRGMAVSKVILRRSDLEALEFATDGGAELFRRAQIVPASGVGDFAATDADTYPRFKWSVGPYFRFRFFDQYDPLKVGVGLQANAELELSRGLIARGSVNAILAGNLDDRPPMPDRKLHPVRSASYFYDKLGNPELSELSLTYYHKLAPEVYGRVSVGYLERMYGGVSTEMLWMPVNRRWAVGAEVNYVAQRDPGNPFGFRLPAEMFDTDFCGGAGQPACAAVSSYKVLTGHVSGYYAFDNGFHAQVDVGRYLAGDVGATVALKREFENGWKIGAFMTKTNVSASDFGSGSFDKGITIEIPAALLYGTQTRKTSSTTLRPFGRDGGRRLEVEGRLYETVRSYKQDGLSEQWGRFWK